MTIPVIGERPGLSASLPGTGFGEAKDLTIVQFGKDGARPMSTPAQLRNAASRALATEGRKEPSLNNSAELGLCVKAAVPFRGEQSGQSSERGGLGE